MYLSCCYLLIPNSLFCACFCIAPDTKQAWNILHIAEMMVLTIDKQSWRPWALSADKAIICSPNRQALAWAPVGPSESRHESCLNVFSYCILPTLIVFQFWSSISLIIASAPFPRHRTPGMRTLCQGYSTEVWLFVLFYVPATVGAVSRIFLWGGLISKGSSVSLLQRNRRWQAKVLPQWRSKPKLPANGGAASASALRCQLQLWPQHLPEVCRGINQ